MNNPELNITPIQTYQPPQIPTLKDNNTTILKKLPSRWQKSAKLIACLGLIGTFTLSGCTFPFTQPSTNNTTTLRQVSYDGYNEADLVIRLHVGGAGGSFYVVHLTEQEALGIIRARLEAAGLNFNATPPEHVVDWRWYGEIELDLFDPQKAVAITQLSWESSNLPFSHWNRDAAMEIEELFSEQTSDITIGAFYNPGERFNSHVQGRGDNWVRRTVSQEEAAETIPTLKAQLNSQADEFIALLQDLGILD